MDKKKLAEVLNAIESPFKFSVDRYSAVKIEADDLPDTKEEFEKSFTEFISEIVEKGAVAVWLKIPIEKSSFIEVAASLGLEFHHTQGGMLTMTKWLSTTKENKLPNYATHY